MVAVETGDYYVTIIVFWGEGGYNIYIFYVYLCNTKSGRHLVEGLTVPSKKAEKLMFCQACTTVHIQKLIISCLFDRLFLFVSERDYGIH